MDALLLQVGISGPVVLGLMLHSLPRPGASSTQRTLFWLLGLMLVWMAGMVVSAHGDPRVSRWAPWLLLPPACFMAPVFCLMMLRYARVELFEAHRSTRWAVVAPFAFFLLAFATDERHGLMLGVGNVLRADPLRQAGPLFWAFQFWSNLVALVGVGTCAALAWKARAPGDRRRMGLLALGVVVPLGAHLLYVFRVLPLEAPLTPGALGVTALLLVAAIRRYRLFDVQPVARRDVIEASGDAVVVADAEEVVVDLNPAAAALLGAPREVLCGAPLAELLEPLLAAEDRSRLSLLLEGLREDRKPPCFELETPDGRVLEISGGAPRDVAGGRAGFFVVLRDRSNERRAERLLYQTQKLESVGSLAAGVAHEVNNPLAFVRANLAHLEQVAALLEERRGDLPKEMAEETSDLADVVADSVAGLERIRGIVQGLLRFTRMPSGRLEARDANELLREAARFASLDSGASVRLEAQLGGDLPPVQASADQLVQVLLNLFLNAKHATAGRPDSAILARSELGADGRVEIRIADNGPGVPEPLRERIFDPFFTTRPPNEGTGLGLSIARDIVVQHGGTLELDPVRSSLGGACFVVRLPAADALERRAS